MEKDIRTAYAQFNEKAQRHFFSVFTEFSEAVHTGLRHADENVFQLLRAKYIASLRQRLEKSAILIMNEWETAENLGRLRINFTESINYFIKEFTRKSEAV